MLDDKPALRDLRTRILELRAMPGFAMLDMDTLALLAESSRVRRLRRGDVLLRADRPVELVYLSIDGGIQVSHGQIKLDLDAFGGIGFLNLLAGQRGGVDAIAVVDCRVLEVPAATALRVMNESFAITRLTIRSLSRQLVDRRGALPADEGGPEMVALGSMRQEPMTLVERLIMLRRTPLGHFANMDATAEIARGMTEQRVPAGEKIWSIGEPSPFWIGIEYGRVRCEAPDSQVAWAGTRRVLGVLDSWGDLPRSYSAVAETPLVIHRVKVATMLAIAETHGAMGVKMSRFLARDLIDSEDSKGQRSLRGGLRQTASPTSAR